MIDLNEVGAVPHRDAAGSWQVRFGIYLPGITYNKGYTIKARIIHAEEQFVRGIEPKEFFLNWNNGSVHDLWNATVPLVADPASNFGKSGIHLYRFQLLRGNEEVIFWFSDPFGRLSGLGTLSAFVIGDDPQPFVWNDDEFRTELRSKHQCCRHSDRAMMFSTDASRR